MASPMTSTAASQLINLPDELILHILGYLEVDALLATSRVSHHLRTLALDPLLHELRLRWAHDRVQFLLPRRPPLQSLQPPVSTIYLSRTHLAARKLHWSLVTIRLQRSLLRRPKISTLVSNNILPPECCKYDRRSGEIVWGTGVAGTLVERKRKVEKEQIKEGLKVWLERKAREISMRKKEGGVGVMVWRFSKKMRVGDPKEGIVDWPPVPKQDKVSRMRGYFEGLIAMS